MFFYYFDPHISRLRANSKKYRRELYNENSEIMCKKTERKYQLTDCLFVTYISYPIGILRKPYQSNSYVSG